VVKSGEVVLGKILSDKESVHRRRSAEAGDSALGEERHDLCGIKAVKIVDHNCTLVEPLTVDFSPESLRPTGIGDGKVQTVRFDTLPPAGGDDVSKRVGKAMDNGFRESGRAAAEEHDRGISRLEVGRTLKLRLAFGILLIEVVPILVAAVNTDTVFDVGTLFRSFMGIVGDLSIDRADDRAYISTAFEGVTAHRAEIDEKIEKTAVGWTLDRMNLVDLTILRLAVWEILYAKKIPHSVSVAEALELIQQYSDPEDKAFVNGILGTIVREAESAR
jgi:N utilization substance protein B